MIISSKDQNLIFVDLNALRIRVKIERRKRKEERRLFKNWIDKTPTISLYIILFNIVE
jgi:hypothetical protein